MNKKGKIVLGSITALIFLTVLLVRLTGGVEAGLLEVRRGPIAKVLKEEGKVVPDIEQPVCATYGGKIADLPAYEGQVVKKGDLLARMDSTEARIRLDQLNAQLRSAQAGIKDVQSMEIQVDQARVDLQAVQADFERIDQLFKAGAVSRKDHEDAGRALESAKNALRLKEETLSGMKISQEGTVKSLQAEIELLSYQLDQSTILAPADGVVSGITVKPGQMVAPGEKVMTVFQDSSLLVEVFVLTGEVSSIKSGMPVDLIQKKQSGDIRFGGTVRDVAPVAEEKLSALGLAEQRVKIRITPEIPAGLVLRPGYELNVEFITEKEDNHLVVPKTALFIHEGSDAVWVVRDGKAEARLVQQGFKNDYDVAVLEGLQEGDKIILNPSLDGLDQGVKVKEAKGK